MVLGVDGTPLVHGLSDDVHDTPKGLLPHRHHDRRTGVRAPLKQNRNQTSTAVVMGTCEILPGIITYDDGLQVMQ